MTAPDHFEDRLLGQLRQVVAERPAPLAPVRHRSRRTPLALAGGAAAVAAVVAIVASSSDVTSSAYAVESQADGAVTVHIVSLSDAAGLEHSLRAAGIPAVVDYVAAGPGDAGCTAAAGGPEAGAVQHAEATASRPSVSTQGGKPGGEPSFSGSFSKAGPGAAGGPKMTSKVSVGSDGATFTVDPGAIEPGQRLYVTTSTGTMSTIGMAISKEAPRPLCVGGHLAP